MPAWGPISRRKLVATLKRVVPRDSLVLGIPRVWPG